MNFIIYPLLFLFGLIFGSFLNVLIYRLNEENVPKFWQGRSFCPKCKHTLSWMDNVPLLSYLLLSGKCRYCKKKISLQYPIVELVAGVSTVAVFVFGKFGGFGIFDLLGIFAYLTLVYSLIVIFFSDLKYMLIPDEMVLTSSLSSLIILLLTANLYSLTSHVVTGLLCSIALLLIVMATRGRGLGMGDVKFAFPMGLLLGFPNILVAFWLAFVSGGVVAVGMVFLRRKRIGDTLALGPFLVLGTIVAMIYSAQLLKLIGVQ